MFGAGAKVTLQDGHLMLRPLTVIPSIRSGFRLHPNNEGSAEPWQPVVPPSPSAGDAERLGARPGVLAAAGRQRP